jgi:outer membrane protein assembly factor BamB
MGFSVLTPATDAATTYKTFAYVAALPSHVGIGDEVVIYMWIDRTAPSADMDNPYRVHNYKLVITKPDNSTEEKTWETVQDTTSNQAYVYSPTMTGTYTLKFYYGGENINASAHAGTNDDVFLPSNATTTFTVQEESIGRLPDTYPLPTEYWTRPIYGENSIWYLVSSNWLGNGAPGYLGFESSYNYGGNGALFPDNAVGSETSHIMWTKSLQAGGVVGGDDFQGFNGNTYFEGSAYLQRYINPIIVNGKLYYTEPLSYLGATGGDTVCVDLRTGKEYWRSSAVPALSHAIIFDSENPNQHGVYQPLLVAATGGGFFGGPTSWRVFDADTGRPLFNASNIPSGRAAMGPMGENLIYQTTNIPGQGYVVREWNSSLLWTWSDTPALPASPIDASATSRYDWTVPITYQGKNWTTAFTVVEAYYNDIMLCYNGSLPSTGTGMFFGGKSQADYTYFAVSLNKTAGTYGQIKWMNTIHPTDEVTILRAGVDPVNRVFVENIRELNAFIGYNLDTGARIWDTKAYPQAAMDYYGSPASASLANMFAYGKMYSSAYAGILYCYDTTNGKLLWTYGNGGPGNSTDGGVVVPGNYPTFVNGYANGLIYTVTTEHTIETPLYKGSLSRAINATDGTEVWTLNSYVGEFMYQSYAIADGYNTWFNGLSNQIYVVGRGPSQTTATAPNTGLTLGQSVVIRGTVTDIASGTKQDEQAARFPNGVPVSSDASMKDWMAYVYQQKPLPTNFTGVEVNVQVIDSNGNCRPIGVAKTDASGMYSISWTPDITGDYQVIAQFAGNKGYWGSYAETSFTVDEPAPTATPMPTPEPSAADLYFVPAIAGLFVAIIVVGLLTILVLRKRP